MSSKRELDPSQLLSEYCVLRDATVAQFDAFVGSMDASRGGFGGVPSDVRRPSDHGAIKIELRVTSLGRIDFGLVHCSGPMSAESTRDASSPYLLQFPLTGGATYVVEGRPVSVAAPHGVVISPSTHSRRVGKPGWYLAIAIQRQFVRERLESRVGSKVTGPLTFDPLLPPGSTELRNYALLTVEAIDRGYAPRGSTLASTLEQGLVDMLLDVQSHSRVEEIVLAEAKLRSNRVQMVREMVERKFAEPLRLEDLARAADCSVRALQTAFTELCGIQPMEFVRRHRLSRAREMLDSATPETRIMEVARGAGFTNPSRFAAAYEEMFGELPSDTLRRVVR